MTHYVWDDKKMHSISKSTKSHLGKLQKYSSTPSSSLRKIQHQKSKKDFELTDAHSSKKHLSSSFAIKASSKAKKSSVSSPQENSIEKRKKLWKGYDWENLPKLSDEQLADTAENALSLTEWRKIQRAKRRIYTAS